MCEGNKKMSQIWKDLENIPATEIPFQKMFYFKPVLNNGAGTRNQRLAMRKLSQKTIS